MRSILDAIFSPATVSVYLLQSVPEFLGGVIPMCGIDLKRLVNHHPEFPWDVYFVFVALRVNTANNTVLQFLDCRKSSYHGIAINEPVRSDASCKNVRDLAKTTFGYHFRRQMGHIAVV